jgi:uncharacterized protein
MSKKKLRSNEAAYKDKLQALDTGLQALQHMSAVAFRAALASKLGKSFEGKRDIYEALGFLKILSYADYEARYARDPLAKRIIDAPALECWGEMPEVVETDAKDTPFEKAWQDLVKAHGLLSVFSNVDRLSGIMNYAVILLGFDDSDGDLSKPVDKPTKLLYAMSYPQNCADIASYEQDSRNPRFGLPLTYRIKSNSGASVGSGSKQGNTLTVHYSRIIHVAEDCLYDRINGIPRMEAAFNNLMNVELVSCSSSEMFWRDALRGLALMQDADAEDMTEPEKTAFTEKVEAYMHGFSRLLALKGIDIKELGSNVADPSNHINVFVDLISAATGIPKRILLGQELGQLAGAQDERAYANRMANRQKRHCEPNILWKVIYKLIELGILPPPKNNLEAHWKDLLAPGEKEVADTGLVKAQTIATLANAVGFEEYYPLDFVDKNIMGLSEEEIALLNKQRGTQRQLADEPLPTDPGGAGAVQ